MTTHAAETRDAAANIEHEWDARALDWPLTYTSIVVEIGGFKGRWALQIQERYFPKLYVFEPQAWAYAVCKEVLGKRAVVFDYALGTYDGRVTMGEWETDGCSIVKPGETTVPMHEIGAAFAELGLDHIDLMLINIEGYEYTLIPHMLDRGILPQRLMVQFHTFADPTGHGSIAIRSRLDRLGYTVAWTYGEVLTAWERL
jgi:FkbM family methyltransferase